MAKNDIEKIRSSLGISEVNIGSYSHRAIPDVIPAIFDSISPIDLQKIGAVEETKPSAYEEVVHCAKETFSRWSQLPAPKRGEVIREMAEALRAQKDNLGKLVSIEVGKIYSEGAGEIQEAIDIADFAVGLSRQLYGLAMHSERPFHRMYEQWHPLGTVGVITAFNFPVAVWAWNAMIAAVCGNTVIWKPSELAPLSAIATINICRKVAAAHGFPGLFTLINGKGREIGQTLASDSRIALISATGSTEMGRSVGEIVSKRFGKALLELGGNNAVIVLEDADLDLATRAVLFGAVGTAGQRCTTTRRLLVAKSIKSNFVERLVAAYKKVKIGNPLEQGVLMGPLINQAAVNLYLTAIDEATKSGATLLYGGELLKGASSPLFVKPTILDVPKHSPILRKEVFAPLLSVVEVDSLEEAIHLNNDVPQGLSSSLFTRSLSASEHFLSHLGSDCGIANVNIGTSGAEIGGAFGGEKETGGGRESGSDAWKIYMRRQTNTINWGNDLPLAQGVTFS